MSINRILKVLLFLTVLFFQLQFQSLKAEDTNNLDDEELPAIDPLLEGLELLIKEAQIQLVKSVKVVEYLMA